ncbi:MAG: SpoIIE family protein phosphatase [Candidatus Micrarchaeota archaeon]|nr:SpoIIE family protein phosphatase [Candidatus Micrarchaeota archaeon]
MTTQSRIGLTVHKPNERNVTRHLGGFLLPSDRSKDSASYTFEQGKFSVFMMNIPSGIRERRYQDSAFVSIRERHVLLGVCDGLGEHGQLFSDLVARKFLDPQLKTKTKFPLKNPAAVAESLTSMVMNVSAMINNELPNLNDGTTVTLAVVIENGEYFIAKVGDSEPYIINSDGVVRKAFTGPNFIIVPELRFRSPIGMNLDDYIKYRAVVDAIISSTEPRLRTEQVKITGGKLGSGEILALTTDGVTKNLRIKVKDEKIVDSDECPDFSRLVKDLLVATPIDIAGAQLIHSIQTRARLNTINYEPTNFGNANVFASEDDDISLAMIGILG